MRSIQKENAFLFATVLLNTFGGLLFPLTLGEISNFSVHS